MVRHPSGSTTLSGGHHRPERFPAIRSPSRHVWPVRVVPAPPGRA